MTSGRQRVVAAVRLVQAPRSLFFDVDDLPIRRHLAVATRDASTP